MLPRSVEAPGGSVFALKNGQGYILNSAPLNLSVPLGSSHLLVAVDFLKDAVP